MAAHRKKPNSDLIDPANRVRRVVEGLFAGNCTSMATEIGCSPSMLTRIVKGERKPGRALLQKIGELPRVNAAWILAGVGESFVGSTTGKTDTGDVLPIARILFEGNPSDNEPCLSGNTCPITPAKYRPTRYWLPVERNETSQLHELRLFRGDMLLMEPASSCRSSVTHVQNRICIYRDVPSNTLQLGYITHDAETDDSRRPLYVIRLNLLQDNEKVETTLLRTKRKSQLRIPSPWTNIGLRDIVAISISLDRNFDLGIPVNLEQLKVTGK